MELRELGKTGEKVSAIGVGTWAAGGKGWGGSDDKKSVEAFERAIDLGINFFDTAPAYGYGHAERLLGPILKAKRKSVFLATKFGLVWESVDQPAPDHCLRPASIKAECDASLKRLQIESIDLYQAHWPLKGDAMTKTVAEDMMSALHALRDAGKVRHVGVSNFSEEQMDWCGGGAALVSHQPALSILRPGAAGDVIPYGRAQGMSAICYSPLFRGLLTGKYNGEETFPPGDTRGEHPDYKGERFKGICSAAKSLKEYADKHATTIAGVSINWVLCVPGVTVALAGTRSKEQIEGASKGAGWALTPEECCAISGLFKDYARDPRKEKKG